MQILSWDTILLSIVFPFEETGESLPKDDVDRVFERLQPCEPPVTIVQKILERIRQLPPEQKYQPRQPDAKRPNASRDEAPPTSEG